MRRPDLEQWISVVGVVLIVGPALPVLFGATDLLVPRLLWGALLAVLLAVLLVLWHAAERGAGLHRLLYAGLIPLSWALLFAAPEATWQGLSSVLVAVATTGVFLVPLRVTILVAVLNTIVVVVIGVIVSAGLPDLGTGVFVLLLQLSMVLVFTLLRTEHRLRAELAEAYVAREAAEAILGETARAAERLRIARELHDVLGHQLTLLNLKLEATRFRRGATPDPDLDAAYTVGRALLDDVRATVSDLRRSQVRTLAETLRELGGVVPDLDVSVEVSGDLEIDEEQQIVLLRSVQEIVTNTIRHADARALTINVARDPERIVLVAGDDGKGAGAIVPGNGLRGLAERFAHVGGGVEFAGDAGFRVHAWMPAR